MTDDRKERLLSRISSVAMKVQPYWYLDFLLFNSTLRKYVVQRRQAHSSGQW